MRLLRQHRGAWETGEKSSALDQTNGKPWVQDAAHTGCSAAIIFATIAMQRHTFRVCTGYYAAPFLHVTPPDQLQLHCLLNVDGSTCFKLATPSWTRTQWTLKDSGFLDFPHQICMLSGARQTPFISVALPARCNLALPPHSSSLSLSASTSLGSAPLTAVRGHVEKSKRESHTRSEWRTEN